MKLTNLVSAIVIVVFSMLFAPPALGDEVKPGAPLSDLKFKPLPLGEIRPSGWLKDQLRVQADGLTGHLDEFWPDIKDSGWIGGKAEGWERVPYWLDGLVPLAYQLDDPKLKAKVKRYMDYALEHQMADGWLGPVQSATGKYKPLDPWPVFVMLKAMSQYQEASGDPRVIPAMQKFLKRLQSLLAERPLFDWNRMRWQDGAISVFWLHERTGEPWLLELAATLKEQGYDWQKHFADLPHKEKVQKWEHESHVVNNAQAIKTAGIVYRMTQKPEDAAMGWKAIRELDLYHGQAAGIFSGDENFAGKMPSQGTETCAVVEYLYSLEILAQTVGYPPFGDRLETLAFNALPAPFKPDMWARQYVQQANQPVAQVSKERIYTTNGEKANVYGLETNYGCCTANMHQGWPKFVSSLWMKVPSNGIAAVAYAPSIVKTSINQVPVTIETVTDYPFSDQLKFVVTAEAPVMFNLILRVPAWARRASVKIGSGETRVLPVKSPGEAWFTGIAYNWSGATEVVLTLEPELQVERRFNDSVTLRRGGSAL